MPLLASSGRTRLAGMVRIRLCSNGQLKDFRDQDESGRWPKCERNSVSHEVDIEATKRVVCKRCVYNDKNIVP